MLLLFIVQEELSGRAKIILMSFFLLLEETENERGVQPCKST